MSANVDAAELARFDRIASRWWDPDGEMGPLHAINPARTRYIAKATGGFDGLRVADVGCGAGLLSEAMARGGARVTGVDLATEVLEVARRHAAESRLEIEYREVSAEALADECPAGFDLVTCLEMLEHVPDPESVVAACAKLVRPGGDVVFSTINRNPRSWLGAIVGAEYLLNLVPRGTHDYAKFIRPSELDEWSRATGLQTRSIQGLSYNPLTRTARLSEDVGINYLMHLRRPE